MPPPLRTCPLGARERRRFPATLHACARRSSAAACTNEIRGRMAGAVAEQARPDWRSSARTWWVTRLPEDPATKGLGHWLFDLGATDSRRHQRVLLRSLATQSQRRQVRALPPVHSEWWRPVASSIPRPLTSLRVCPRSAGGRVGDTRWELAFTCASPCRLSCNSLGDFARL